MESLVTTIWLKRALVLPFLLLELAAVVLYLRWWGGSALARVSGMLIALLAVFSLAYAYAWLNAWIAASEGIQDDGVLFGVVLLSNAALFTWFITRVGKLRTAGRPGREQDPDRE